MSMINSLFAWYCVEGMWGTGGQLVYLAIGMIALVWAMKNNPYRQIALKANSDAVSEDPTEIPYQKVSHRRSMSAGFLVNTADNRRYDLLPGDTSIGRKASVNDIVISDPTVAREHILIREQNGHYTLFDRGSSTGTLINNQKLRGSILLEDGDLISLGDATLKFFLVDKH